MCAEGLTKGVTPPTPQHDDDAVSHRKQSAKWNDQSRIVNVDLSDAFGSISYGVLPKARGTFEMDVAQELC